MYTYFYLAKEIQNGELINVNLLNNFNLITEFWIVIFKKLV